MTIMILKVVQHDKIIVYDVISYYYYFFNCILLQLHNTLNVAIRNPTFYMSRTITGLTYLCFFYYVLCSFFFLLLFKHTYFFPSITTHRHFITGTHGSFQNQKVIFDDISYTAISVFMYLHDYRLRNQQNVCDLRSIAFTTTLIRHIM